MDTLHSSPNNNDAEQTDLVHSEQHEAAIALPPEKGPLQGAASLDIFTTQKTTALAFIAKLLAFFPGFTNPQRDDVIIANRILNFGLDELKTSDLPIAKDAMDSARSFYSKYASLLGLAVGGAISAGVEWLQHTYPEYQAIRAAHVGSGVIASWVVHNIMGEYERRIHQLKEHLN
ncbi:hypothetical protein L1077_03255 [Pseudoalteromonas luteoviolacea]|uniref:hypothetical protein n=1 Tax=Pseudoalteromonas luteoviolacea TaxID=43657 RepID=UPI001F323EE5|nr:hypothetical protein [Pseudoalteromonas luteoviolacea]MCF6438447.1 hypothetical protein [Pseudoalteromonas luteoviolacea]